MKRVAVLLVLLLAAGCGPKKPESSPQYKLGAMLVELVGADKAVRITLVRAGDHDPATYTIKQSALVNGMWFTPPSADPATTGRSVEVYEPYISASAESSVFGYPTIIYGAKFVQIVPGAGARAWFYRDADTLRVFVPDGWAKP